MQPESFSAVAPKRNRILLAEDNEVNLTVIRDYLEHKGFAVTVVRTGRAVLDMIAAAAPDIILMDIQMPEMDGLETMRILRTIPAYRATPIIAVTALAMVGDRERCLAAGANAYLVKPMRLQELLETVRDLLL